MNSILNSWFFSCSVFVCLFVCTDVRMYFRMYAGAGEPGGTSTPTAIYGQYSTEDSNNKNYDTKS